MAKSYITTFTEYVAEQRDNLENALKNRGVPVTPAMSMGSLVSLIGATNTDLSYTFEYDRDKNFPDIDTMFDNDILREANGGEYRYCAYAIVRVFSDNTIYFPSNYYYASPDDATVFKPYFSKVCIGNDIIVDLPNKTTAGNSDIVKYVLSEEDQTQLITGEDGYKYILARAYYNTDMENCYYTTQYNFGQCVEAIADTSPLLKSLNIPTGTATVRLLYARFPLTNASQENIYSKPSSDTSVSISPSKVLRIDGIFKCTTIASTAENVLIYGEYVKAPTSTATAATLTIGSSSTTNSSSTVQAMYNRGTLITPYSTLSMTLKILGSTPKHFIIQEGATIVEYYTYSSYGGRNCFTCIESLNLPSTITKVSDLAYSSSLKNLSIASGAFNTSSATTISFERCYSLTKEAMLKFFNSVADKTGATANIVKIPKQINVQLTDEEKAIITNKNWTISVGSN